MEHHLPTLISDLALILGAGAIVTLLFRKIKQPLVLGYIIAGYLIGPYVGFLPTVADEANIKTLAEIGVIFLLFGLGIEFSFKKLMNVGGYATITALGEIAFIVVAGYFVGKLLGWSTMDCLFLGGMLASSSTAIIIRTFDELKIKTKAFARVVFGVLVVEDIVVILLMVLLSTVAVTQHIEGTELLFTVAKLVFFLILWFVMGIYLIPTFLKKIKGSMDDEGYLILSIGLCLAMVFIAVQVGFSAELGAFIMGSILAETVCAEKIEHIIKPVKDLFGTVFFVSVGMMIDPSVMREYGWTVVIVTLLVIFGKTVITILGALISGQTLKQSVQVGMSMAQIGEFAFIVATLGLTLGVISEFLFPVAVGVSAITTFVTPYLIKYSDKTYILIEKALPDKWLAAINNYSASAHTIQAESEWRKFVRSSVIGFINNGIIFLALILIGIHSVFPFFTSFVPNYFTAQIITAIVVLAFSSPFIWAMMFRTPNNIAYKELWTNPNYKNGPLLALGINRILVTVLLIIYFVCSIFPSFLSAVIVVLLVILGLYLASKHTRKMYERIENTFLANYRSREIDEARQRGVSSNIIEKEFIPHAKTSLWDINLVDLEIHQDVEYVGQTIGELSWREKYGVNIVYIKRGEQLLYAPGPKEKLLSFDHIGVIASEDQFEKFMPVFNKKIEVSHSKSDVEDIVIQKIIIDSACGLNNVAIKNSGIRELTDGLVVGIERENKRFLNPTPTTVFQLNDIVWLVGDKKKLSKIEEIQRSDL
jgi:CPA2 family monovalent cation:H+ antiporter-2